jgi:hypothetical protein
MCKEVYQRKHEYETIWYDQSVSSTKGIKIKENLITMIWSIVMKFDFIRMASGNCEMQSVLKRQNAKHHNVILDIKGVE